MVMVETKELVDKVEELKNRFLEIHQKAYFGSGMNGQDRAALKELGEEAERISAQSKRIKSDAEAIGAIDRMLKGIPGPGIPAGAGVNAGGARPSASWSKAIAGYGEAMGSKTLLASAGTVEVPNVLSEEIQRLPNQPTSVHQLVATTTVDNPTFAYYRQNLRTNNAEVVAPGDLKPTSSYDFELVDGKCVTIAHLSEPIPRQGLADYTNLDRFVQAELVNGLLREVDRQILHGADAAGITGILETSGIQTQPSTGDRIETARKARTSLEEFDVAPTAWVMTPADWELVELERDDNERFMLDAGASLPVSAGRRELWGIPVVTSSLMTSGYALLGDYKQAQLLVREQVQVTWSENTDDDFARNLVRFRCEGRFGVGVIQPFAFVQVHLSGVSD